jgi:hypothetical protein
VLNSKNNRDPRRVALVCFAVGSSFVLLGNRPSCDDRPPTLTCDQISLQLDPGSCVEFTNPCGDHEWERLDAFRLCDAPAGLFIQTQREPRARFLCADASVALIQDVPVDFFYARPGDSGVGAIRVTVGSTPLTVAASANPPNITSGGSSQLLANATGGNPPYTYSWSPASGLSATDVADPIASPTVSTQYTVVVRDSSGAQQGAAVIVNVGLGVSATATPPTIAVGGSSNLSATVVGGTPPYSFSWTPAASLSAPNVGSPVASPIVTTRYDLTVTDFNGATALASVTVAVGLAVSASANPASITSGGQSQLDVIASGGAPPYTYSWSPAASLDNATLQNPIATPGNTTTYTVVVTDSNGTAASAMTTVTVTAPALTACFSVTVVNPFASQGNGSCSNGAITQYRWWSNFLSPTQPPNAVTTTPISPVFSYETPGPKTMRLEVIDGTGATAASQQTFTTL